MCPCGDTSPEETHAATPSRLPRGPRVIQRLAVRLAPLPYVAAFVAAPLAVLAGKLAGREGLALAFGPRGLGLWLALAALAMLAALAQTGRERIRAGRSWWPAAAAAIVMAGASWVLARQLRLALFQVQDMAPLLDELRAPAMLAFSALWAWSFGAPARRFLALAGAALGALCVLDFLLTAIMARSLVLGGGYLFGAGPGAQDILGLLLCTALCATLDDRPEPGAPRLARWLILAGILAGFSLPALGVAALLCLTLEHGPFRERLAMACALGLAGWIALTLPLPRPAMGEDLGLAWHASAVAEALRQDPRAFALGLPLDRPMALAMPEMQGLIWDAEGEGLPVSVFEIPSSALRLLAAWGVGGLALPLGAALFCAWRGRSRQGLGLCAVLAAGSLLTPLLHTPASAAAIALALAGAAHDDSPGDETQQQRPTGV